MQPWWLARQRDPDSAAYHPTFGAPVNAVGRSWTLVGNLDSGRRTAVDRRGLVCAGPGRWSLDWWLKPEEEWIFPSQTSGVRQRLVDGAPVVETVVRAAGGDIVQRVYAARQFGDATVIEVENQGTAPVAVALAVRPYDVQGAGRITSVAGISNRIEVDGSTVVAFDRVPGQVVAAASGADAAQVLREERTTEPTVSCDSGLANLAAVFPLVHGTTLRAVVPEDSDVLASFDIDAVSRAPGGDAVAGGWGQHAVSALRVVLPPGRFADAFDATRQSILLAHTGPDVSSAPYGPPTTAADDADVLVALSDAGYGGSVREVLLARGRSQSPLGRIDDARGDDVTASTLIATDHALRLEPDAALVVALSEVVADAVRWLLANDEGALIAPALAAGHRLLELAGATSAAAELAAVIAERPSSSPVVAPHDGVLFEDREGPRGYEVLSTARAAVACVASDPALAWARLDAVLGVASPTWTWPTHAHPKLLTGTGGAGHDLRVTAAVVRSALGLLVHVGADGALRLAGHWPAAWLGQGVEIHGAPTALGRVSWAVRWHGDRPALLWEVEGAANDIRVLAPGLDPAWSGSGAQGEALLATPTIVEEVAAVARAESDDEAQPPSGPGAGASFT